MFKNYISLIALILVIGCSSSQNTVKRNPSNTSENRSTEPVVEITVNEATENWHHTDPNSKNGFEGIGSEKAYSDLLVNKSPKKKVVVAVIDSGVDIEHEDLSANIWINEDEIAGNGIDDDNNGYVDDIHGWNFIGGKDGSHVNKDTYEVTRIYNRLHEKFKDDDFVIVSKKDSEEFALYEEVKAELEKNRLEAKQNYNNLVQVKQALEGAKSVLGVSSIDSISVDKLKPSPSDNAYEQQAKQMFMYFKSNGVKEEDIEEAYNHFDKMYNYAYNTDFDPRHIVGDDFSDLSNRYYGNNDVKGPRSNHGTHVAGIIGAVRNNNKGMNGVANHVSIMVLRAVPDGDERDKDVGNAIRYAVENGADIINMSFGKDYSPRKFYVDEALKFADEQGVLVVHAAGNSGANIDSTNNFPNKFYTEGGSMQNYITVGASSWEGDSLLASSFTNYGYRVDIFAPGVSIYSTYPENTYKAEDGTSMASPVVAGAAALIMAYYPELSAQEVKQLLISSATNHSNRIVYKPGTDEAVPFGSLSASGGLLNIYNALLKAENKTLGTH